MLGRSTQPVLQHSKTAALPPDPGSTPSREMATLTPGRWTPSSKGQLVPTVSWVLPSAHHPGLRHDPEPTSAWPGFHHQFICCPGHQTVTQNWSHPALPPTCPLTTSQPGWLGGWATLPDLCTLYSG